MTAFHIQLRNEFFKKKKKPMLRRGLRGLDLEEREGKKPSSNGNVPTLNNSKITQQTRANGKKCWRKDRNGLNFHSAQAFVSKGLNKLNKQVCLRVRQDQWHQHWMCQGVVELPPTYAYYHFPFSLKTRHLQQVPIPRLSCRLTPIPLCCFPFLHFSQ